jgi:hypothetical protein
LRLLEVESREREQAEEIRKLRQERGDLQSKLERAAKAAPTAAGRSRATEQLARRMCTLYKNLEQIGERSCETAMSDESVFCQTAGKSPAEDDFKGVSGGGAGWRRLGGGRGRRSGGGRRRGRSGRRSG